MLERTASVQVITSVLHGIVFSSREGFTPLKHCISDKENKFDYLVVFLFFTGSKLAVARVSLALDILDSYNLVTV